MPAVGASSSSGAAPLVSGASGFGFGLTGLAFGGGGGSLPFLAAAFWLASSGGGKKVRMTSAWPTVHRFVVIQ